MQKTLYQQLLEAGCEIDNHCSDLYVKRDKTSKPIIDKYQKQNLDHSIHVFISQIDNEPWYDIPFMYEPYWEAKQNRG